MKPKQEAPMPRVLAFLKRSGSLYDSMKNRFRERKYKTGRLAGRVFRAARELPFTRTQFQDWLSGKLGGPDGAVQCRYCRVWLTAMDVSVDHLDPVAQGGSLDFPNLDVCCQTCNDLKGGVSLATFMRLLEMLHRAGIPGEMTVADRKSIESRLKSGNVQFKGKPKAQSQGEKPKLLEPTKSLFESNPKDDKW